MARPVIAFDQAIADEICERLVKGESLRQITGSGRDDFMPCRATILKWLAENDAFSGQYARAREAQGDDAAERAVEEAMTALDAGIGRLRMDALKWKASKLAPKKYGDRIDHNHGGELGLKVEIVRFADDSAP